MPITPEQLDKVRVYIDDAITLGDLTKGCWRKQTDVVKQAFIFARLFADLNERAVFVDGHINEIVKAKAVERKNVTGFFNRRCHDFELKTRRAIIFDTVTTKAMGARRSGRAHLHFHAAFEVPEGQTRADLEKKLRLVFGNADRMGRRQFHYSHADFTKSCSHGDVKAHGPIGKMLYAIKHAGSSYKALELNEGAKRSRKAPASRGSDNKKSSRLARGIPSNFNKDVVLCDTLSKRAGKEAFEAWLLVERKKANPPAPTPHAQSLMGDAIGLSLARSPAPS